MSLLAGYWRVVRGFNRDIWLFLCASAFLAFGYLGVMGVLLNLYLLRLGYGPRFIGLLIGSGQLLWALLAMPAAGAGIRYGPRNTMAVGFVLIAIGAALIILVEALPIPWWSAWLAGSWMLLWVGAALNTVNAVPYLMTLSRVEERDYTFAAQASVFAFGAFLGSIIAGLLPGLISGWLSVPLDAALTYRLSLMVAPISFLIAALAIMRVRPVTLPKPQGASGAGGRPTAILVFVMVTLFLIAAVEGALRSFFNVYLDTGLSQSTSRIGLIMGVGQLLPAVAALTAPLLMGWLGAGRTFSFTSFAAGILLLPLAFVAHWAVAALSFVGIIGAVATSQPARNVFTQVCVTPEWRSSSAASATIGVGLGWAAMAVTGGYVVASYGFPALFTLAAVLALTNALILMIYIRRSRYPSASIASAN